LVSVKTVSQVQTILAAALEIAKQIHFARIYLGIEQIAAENQDKRL
jgi:hypothetical protein